MWAFIQAHKGMGMGKKSRLWRHTPHDSLPHFARTWVAALAPEQYPESEAGEEGAEPAGDPCSSSRGGQEDQAATGADRPTAPGPSTPASEIGSEVGSEHSRGRSRSRKARRGGRGRGGGRSRGGRGSSSRLAEGAEGGDQVEEARREGGQEAGPRSQQQRTRSSSRVSQTPRQFWIVNHGASSAPSSPGGGRGHQA